LAGLAKAAAQQNGSTSLASLSSLPLNTPDTDASKAWIALDVELSPPKTGEEGLQKWHEFLTERFVRGKDEDFDYSLVDRNDEFDVEERRTLEEAYFDAEEPGWASDGHDGHVEKLGETGIQDF
jgi:hypothetical protein